MRTGLPVFCQMAMDYGNVVHLSLDTALTGHPLAMRFQQFTGRPVAFIEDLRQEVLIAVMIEDQLGLLRFGIGDGDQASKTAE